MLDTIGIKRDEALIDELDRLYAQVMILQREVIRLGGDVLRPLTEAEAREVPSRTCDEMYAFE